MSKIANQVAHHLLFIEAENNNITQALKCLSYYLHFIIIIIIILYLYLFILLYCIFLLISIFYRYQKYSIHFLENLAIINSTVNFLFINFYTKIYWKFLEYTVARLKLVFYVTNYERSTEFDICYKTTYWKYDSTYYLFLFSFFFELSYLLNSSCWYSL